MNVSRARCLLQADPPPTPPRPVAISAEKKNAVSPKSKPSNGSLGSLSMSRGTLPYGGKLSVPRWNRRLPQGSLLLLAACLYSSAACWMHSPFCAFSASLLSFIYQTFVDLLRILPYPLVSQLTLFIDVPGFFENGICMLFIALHTNLTFYNGYRSEQLLTVDAVVCLASYNVFSSVSSSQSD